MWKSSWRSYFDGLEERYGKDCAEWAENTIADKLGPVGKKFISGIGSQKSLVKLGYKVGMRATNSGGITVTIYKKDQPIAKKTFSKFIKEDE